MRTSNTEKKKRETESNYNKCGSLMKIIKYVDSRNVYVEFQDEHRYVKKVAYHHFKNGQVRNPYEKTIYGVACIGDTSAVIKSKQFKYSYQIWISMITRCYSDKDLARRNTYRDCFVCDEWLCYEYFEKWFDENYYEIEGETMNLEKDILVKGNKIYSPNTCVFAPRTINSLFLKNNVKRGELPIGVNMIGDRYEAHMTRKNKSHHSAMSDTIEGAFNAYKEAKEKEIKRVADEYKDKIPQKLYEAMYKYKVEITD